MYTSGTTGKPKGAIRSHGGGAMLSLVTDLELGFSSRDSGLRNGWGFRADLGLAAKNVWAAHSLGNQPLDDMVRDMRLTPVLQLGVSYRY